MPFRMFVPLIIGGCAPAPVGDWIPVDVQDELGQSAASGVLEIDRDGEVYVELVVAGDGPVGALDGLGTADFETAGVSWVMPATWASGDVTEEVLVDASCQALADAMSCSWQVDEAAWALSFRREPTFD